MRKVVSLEAESQPRSHRQAQSWQTGSFHRYNLRRGCRVPSCRLTGKLARAEQKLELRIWEGLGVVAEKYKSTLGKPYGVRLP
jgi:hypothetical protein